MSDIAPVTSESQPPAPPAPPRKSRAGAFFLGAASGCLIGIFIFSLFAAMIAATRNSGGGFAIGEKVAVIPIEGEIVQARDAVDALHRYAESVAVKAMVIRIDSPGGAVAPSQEIYEEIRKVRKSSGKPIVASLNNVAASGGYYIASACDQIISNPGTITGSIGVIMQWMEIKDLVAWAKMKPETITAGSMKDIGSPYRDMTDAERAYFQRLASQLHQQFIGAVLTGRNGRINANDLNAIADGRVFTGEEAMTLKLVDRIGNLDDAAKIAAQMAGMRGTPSLLYPKKRRPTILDLLTDTTENKTFVDQVVSRRPRFLYRW